LSSAGVVTDDQANQLITLIDNGSQEIQLIFKQYEQHRDVYTLIESLRLASSEAEDLDEPDNDEMGDEKDNDEDDEDDMNSNQRVGGTELGEDESELDEVTHPTCLLFFLSSL
jgi:hypothetical protein